MPPPKICRYTFGKHSVPLRSTPKTIKEFRKVNEEQSKLQQFCLTVGDEICGSCRTIVEQSRNPKGPRPDRVAREETRSHNIYCKDPLQRHPPKRQVWPERFTSISDAISRRCSEKGLSLLQGDRICLSCFKAVKTIIDPPDPSIYCGNPFGLHSDPKKRSVFNSFKRLTLDDVAVLERNNISVPPDCYLCDGCRRHMKKLGPALNSPDTSMEIENYEPTAPAANELDDSFTSTETSPDHADSDYVNVHTEYTKLCKILELLELPPQTTAEIRYGSSASNLYLIVISKLGEIIATVSGRKKNFREQPCSWCEDYLDTVVMKFNEISLRSDMYKLLTCTPEWVSISKLQDIFGISKYMAEKVSRLRRLEGPLSSPGPKIGKPLAPETTEAIVNFYLAPENGNVSPSQRDVIVTERKILDGEKVLVRSSKHYLFMTMRQLYAEFQIQHPEMIVSISKFASLRPKHCVWGYRQGFQKTCLCVHHTNFELMLDAIGETGRTSDKLLLFFCTLNSDCMLGLCSNCPRWDTLETYLDTVEEVQYWKWAAEEIGGGIQLIETSTTKQGFLELFKIKARVTALHHYTYIVQRNYISSLSVLTMQTAHHAVVVVDFGQNYSFVQPNEVSSYHWSHSQATVHPFELMYFCSTENRTKSMTFTVISDHLNHDATSFHAFRYVVITQYIKPMLPNLKVLTYVSDGPSSQYRNVKAFANLANHIEDFGLESRWVYSAAGHGKGPCDRAAALAKRLTRLESMRRKDNYITTPKKMVEFLTFQNRDETKKYIYVSDEDVKFITTSHKIEERYTLYKPIKGTRLYHEVVPKSSSTMLCKKNSGDNILHEHVFKKCSINAPEVSPLNEVYKINEYLAFNYNSCFFVGLIQNIKVEEEGSYYEVLFLKKCEKGESYKWYDPPKVDVIAVPDIVGKLEAPGTKNGRTYTFGTAEIKASKEKFEKLLRELTKYSN